ncbi:methylated-DNA--[protein]-cysteine S-methyltransferase [Pseudonocardia alni]|uniref:methylated-DNA--[protein]-cysteine S-methyltransferase n=1 Tax=Pseudonocardia alni TaxID=33907 RepID=UPI00280A81C1|nr:methylated-DNA--[protein]-cysteine S-methyltransferase [Pseudonocardia alni]
MSTATWSTRDTPAGPFTAVVDDADGHVLASGWTASVDELLALVHRSLAPATVVEGDLGAIGEAIDRYHGGDLSVIDDVPVRQRSGPYRELAWDVLRTVPAGAPVTYTGYAEKTGRPAAVRAAAGACAHNAAALFVPCHRVLRTDGTLGGFRYGLAVKRWLLEHEAV